MHFTMPKLSELQPTLNTSPIKGLFVSEYLATDEIISDWDFGLDADANSATGFSTTIVRDETTAELEGRNFYENYKLVDGKFVPETYHIRPFGGGFEVDLTHDELANGVITENKSRSMMRLATQLAVKQFILGTGEGKDVLGLNKAVQEYKQVAPTALNFSAFMEEMTTSAAFKVLADIRKAKALSPKQLNLAYLGDTDFAALSMVMSITNQSNAIVDFNGTTHINFDGIKWKRIPDNFTGTLPYVADPENPDVKVQSTRAIYLTRESREDGIYKSAPREDKLIRYQAPVNVGRPLAEGFVEFLFANVYKVRNAVVGIPVI